MAMIYAGMDTVEPQETEYLISYPRVPKGDVTVLFGEGSVGKGRLVMHWIAQVINGDPESVVLVVLPEDHPSEQVAPRLYEAGVCDLSRVINLTRLAGGDRFKLSAAANQPGHIGLLRQAVEDINKPRKGMPRRRVAMVVLDPIAALVGWGSIQTNAGARRLIEPVQDLCQDTGIAAVMVAHTVKSGSLQGSAGLSQAARLIYRVHTDPANPTVRLISQAKHNNEKDEGSARFVIEDDGSGPKVIMLDSAEISRRQASWRAPVDSGASTVILDALRCSYAPLSVAQLSDMTGIGVPTLRTLLWRMTRRGQVIGDRGEYWLSNRATA